MRATAITILLLGPLALGCGGGSTSGQDAGASGPCEFAPTETVELKYEYPGQAPRSACLPLLRYRENFILNGGACSYFSTVVWAEQSSTGIQIDSSDRLFASTSPSTIPVQMTDSSRNCPTGSYCTFHAAACTVQATRAGGAGSAVELTLAAPCTLDLDKVGGTDGGGLTVQIDGLVARGTLGSFVQGGDSCP
jgi:hypothetical protein